MLLFHRVAGVSGIQRCSERIIRQCVESEICYKDTDILSFWNVTMFIEVLSCRAHFPRGNSYSLADDRVLAHP